MTRKIFQVTKAESFINLARLLLVHLLFFFSILILFHELSPIIFWPLFLMFSLLHQKELSEWIHEASHYNFFYKKNYNDILVNFLANIFFGFSIANYRKLHFEHHKTPLYLDPKDPDTSQMIAESRSQAILKIFQDLGGARAIKSFFLIHSSSDARRGDIRFMSDRVIFPLCLFLVHGSIFFIVYRYNFFIVYLAYYFVLLTFYQGFSRIRTYGQHSVITDSNVYFFKSANSRTIDAGFIDRLFFTSRIMMYHYEHHKFPSFSFRYLRKIHVPEDNNLNNYTTSRLVTIFGPQKNK